MRKYFIGLIIFSLDEKNIVDALFFSNDVQPRYWDNGDLNFPPAKSQGRTVMSSDFVEPITGFVQYSEIVWTAMKVKQFL